MGSTTTKVCCYIPAALITNVDISRMIREFACGKLLRLRSGVWIQRFHTHRPSARRYGLRIEQALPFTCYRMAVGPAANCKFEPVH